MSWKEPDEIDLSVRRTEFRNNFGYARDWAKEYDLFGDEAAMKR